MADNNTRIPSIEFGEGCDYDALYSVLRLANQGLHLRFGTPQGEGLTYEFHLDDGSIIVGTYLMDEEDDMTIAIHLYGSDTGDRVTVPTNSITRVIYA